MKVLHICNDFLGSKVHANLYSALFHLSLQQVVYFPLRSSSNLRARNDISGIEVIAGIQLKEYHKFLFRKKITDLYLDLSAKVNLKDLDLIHATTLFSDGALAYRAFKNYGVPYVVSVRYTDTDLFLKLRPDLYLLAKEILLKAAQIIFIGNALKENFFEHPFIRILEARIIHKTQVIYNGIDSYWLVNRIYARKIVPTKILYVGNFDDRKNVLRLIKAFLKLKKKYSRLELNLVGKTGNQLKQIKHIANKKNNGVNYIGPVYEKDKLLRIYRMNHIFAMVSKMETFGLVYLEALSQGLPLLFTKSQGIDGIFKERIGEAVNPTSVNSIKNGLNKILTGYGKYNADVDFTNFDWPHIAKQYHVLFKEIILQNSR